MRNRTAPALVPGVRAKPQLPAGVAYEAFISTRPAKYPRAMGLHDFFNGLCWMRFPQTKRRLNQLQAEQIARQRRAARARPGARRPDRVR